MWEDTEISTWGEAVPEGSISLSGPVLAVETWRRGQERIGRQDVLHTSGTGSHMDMSDASKVSSCSDCPVEQPYEGDEAVQNLRRIKRGEWGWCSVAEHLPTIYETLGSIPRVHQGGCSRSGH